MFQPIKDLAFPCHFQNENASGPIPNYFLNYLSSVVRRELTGLLL
jgi:hypothetical protein